MEETLFEKIVESTGLPQELISQELLSRIQAMGFDKKDLTLEQVREVLSEFLQDIILSAKEEYK